MTTLADIERETKAAAEAHTELSTVVTTLNNAIETMKSAQVATIRRLADKFKTRRGAVEALIQGAPHLFEKPRSLTVHGMEVGLRKGAGGVVITDEERTLELIKEHFPEKADGLINTEESLKLAAIRGLGVDELMKIGAGVESAGDYPFCKPATGSVTKLVNGFLKEKKAPKKKR